MRVERSHRPVFPPVTFVPGERLSTVNYARALGLQDAELLDVSAARSSGLGARPVLPAMFGFFLAVTTEDLTETLSFTWGRTLNVGIDVRWHGLPVTEEDQVAGRAMVVDAWERAGSRGGHPQFLRLRAGFARGDTPVCDWEVLFTESRDEPTMEPVDDHDPRDDQGVTALDPDGAGRELPQVVSPVVDRMMLARLSVALDNPDPLHLDDEVARKAGFDSVIGQGSAVVGMLHEPWRQANGLDVPFTLRSQQLRPYGLGDRLVAAGSVADDGSATVEVCDQEGNVIGRGSLQEGLR